MKVKELVALLQNQDQNAEVILFKHDEEDWEKVSSIDPVSFTSDTIKWEYNGITPVTFHTEWFRF